MFFATAFLNHLTKQPLDARLLEALETAKAMFVLNVRNVRKIFLADPQHAKNMNKMILPLVVIVFLKMLVAADRASDVRQMRLLPTLANASLMLPIAIPVVLDPIRSANVVRLRNLEEPSVPVAHI